MVAIKPKIRSPKEGRVSYIRHPAIHTFALFLMLCIGYFALPVVFRSLLVPSLDLSAHTQLEASLIKEKENLAVSRLISLGHELQGESTYIKGAPDTIMELPLLLATLNGITESDKPEKLYVKVRDASFFTRKDVDETAFALVKTNLETADNWRGGMSHGFDVLSYAARSGISAITGQNSRGLSGDLVTNPWNRDARVRVERVMNAKLFKAYNVVFIVNPDMDGENSKAWKKILPIISQHAEITKN